MELSEIQSMLPKEVVEAAKARGISKLTPPQEEAIKKGLIFGNNMVVASPTASGKTFIAEMAMIRAVLHDFKKAIYVAPMRALVSEKYEEIKNAYPFLKVAISIGDLDSLDPWLANYDIIFVSTEKLDSLIRHGIDWLDKVGVIVFDEVHMLDDPSRGPTLDVLITKLKYLCRHAQFIALSATIGNADELARWFYAKLVESDYRPVKLEKGVAYMGKAYFSDNREEALAGNSKIPEHRIAEDTLAMKKQLLIFYATKKYAESGAEKLASIVEPTLTEAEKKELEKVSEKILHALSRPTAQCEKLASLVKRGVAFHHSGLVNEQRHEVEQAFKANLIKAICSTTTLGLGVNLPAHTVVVRDTSRYSEEEGASKLGVNEVVQLFGRAGRPAYDTEGRALLIARSKYEISDLFERYINAPLDPISSKLGALPVLRTHVLAFIATEMFRTKESIAEFLSSTFYGFQFGNHGLLYDMTSTLVDTLEEWGFVRGRGSAYEATRIGKRVSELYIDPLTAKWLIDTLPHVQDDLGILFAISNTLEMRPYAKATEEAEEAFVDYIPLLRKANINFEQEMPFYDPVKPMSTALMLRDWCEEMPEREIIEKYDTTPGSLFTKITNADWLLYSSIELAKLIGVRVAKLHEMRVRVKYGIKSELFDLVRLEQVGRVRARLMYNNGIRKVADLRTKENEKKVESLFGKELAKKILEQAMSM
ncbi:MAG: DEAD/DEAH box helicase [Candidatus Micrarchaeia archaeon]